MEDFWEGGVQDQGNALRQGWPLWPQDGRQGPKMAATTSGDPVTRWGQVHALDHSYCDFVQFRCFCCLYTGHAHSNQSSITL